MPSSMIHLQVARLLQPQGDDLYWIGNLAPDAVIDWQRKEMTHFRSATDRPGKLLEFAQQLHSSDSFGEGVLLHLFVDWVWDIGALSAYRQANASEDWVAGYRDEITRASAYLYHGDLWFPQILERLLAVPLQRYEPVDGATAQDVCDYVCSIQSWFSRSENQVSLFYPPFFVEQFCSRVTAGYSTWRQRQQSEPYLRPDQLPEIQALWRWMDLVATAPPSRREVAARLRELRQNVELSLTEVAARLDVAPEDVMAWEDSTGDIPISTLYALAGLYGVDLTDLLTGQSPNLQTFSVVRSGQGAEIERFPGYHFQSLALDFANRTFEPLLVTLNPQQADDTKLVSHGGQEFNYCLEGRMRVIIGGSQIDLAAGDSIYFDPQLPHAQIALDDRQARFLTVIQHQAEHTPC